MDDLRQALLTLLGADFLNGENTVVLYGSRRSGRDVDLLVVQSTTPAMPVVMVGQLDFLIFQAVAFEKVLTVLDPLAVEPVLTGELLFGQPETLTRWKDMLGVEQPVEPVVHHLSTRSVGELLSCRRILEEHRSANDTEYLRWAFQNLSFSIAYASLARHYASREARPITISELVQSGNAYLPSFWEHREQVKAGLELEHSSVEKWVVDWTRWLTVKPS